MKRANSDRDQQSCRCDARPKKRNKTKYAPQFRGRSASPPVSDVLMRSPPALTDATLLVTQRTHSMTSSVHSWLAIEQEDRFPETPPPDNASKLYPAASKRQHDAMSHSTSEAAPNDGLKRQKICVTADQYGDNIHPEQSASQLGTPLALNTRPIFSPAASRVSSGLKRSSSRSESPRKYAATREDQLCSFIPSVDFAVLDQAQRYSVHIPDTLISLVGQFEVSTLMASILVCQLITLVGFCY